MSSLSAILANREHPFYEKLKVLRIPFYEYKDSNEDFSAYETVFDFTVLPTTQKIELISNIDANVISDLTCNWGEFIFQKCPQLKAALSTAFYSPQATYEVYSFDDSTKKKIEEVFKELNINIHLANGPGFGFIFARTIAQIINEAFFALDDGLASEQAIDTAMKFGVNYPLGPIEWSQRMNLGNVKLLLNELFHYTGEARYRPALSLQKACL